MSTYNPYDTLNLIAKPKVQGVAINFVTLGYSLGAAIDGTHGNMKCWVDVIVKDYAATPTYAVDVSGLTLRRVQLFVDTVEATWAIYPVRKGIAPTVNTTYVAQFVIDETGSGTSAPRIVDFVEFRINVPIGAKMDTTMPYP